MLKITNTLKHEEISYIFEKGKAAIRTIDHLQLRSFRVDLFPLTIVEIILSYCDSEGNTANSTYQFCLRGEDAEQFLDKTKFADFAEHLEEIAANSSKIEHKKLQDKQQACGIECEIVKKKTL
jgi:hypothetical protein